MHTKSTCSNALQIAASYPFSSSLFFHSSRTLVSFDKKALCWEKLVEKALVGRPRRCSSKECSNSCHFFAGRTLETVPTVYKLFRHRIRCLRYGACIASIVCQISAKRKPNRPIRHNATILEASRFNCKFKNAQVNDARNFPFSINFQHFLQKKGSIRLNYVPLFTHSLPLGGGVRQFRVHSPLVCSWQWRTTSNTVLNWFVPLILDQKKSESVQTASKAKLSERGRLLTQTTAPRTRLTKKRQEYHVTKQPLKSWTVSCRHRFEALSKKSTS